MSPQGDTAICGSMTEHLVSDPSNTVIFFDWDDTLHPSTFVALERLRTDAAGDIPSEYQEQLFALESAVLKLLGRALEFGTVVIITNAETGWVELSAQRFMPRVLDMLPEISVISARSTFERFFPDSPLQWKIAAFHREIVEHFTGFATGELKNVISMGDSIHERNAVHHVTSSMVNQSTRTKSIKFVERPNPEQLTRQVELVSGCLEYLVMYTGDLDLMLTIQQLYQDDPVAAVVAGPAAPVTEAAEDGSSMRLPGVLVDTGDLVVGATPASVVSTSSDCGGDVPMSGVVAMQGGKSFLADGLVHVAAGLASGEIRSSGQQQHVEP